MGNPKDVLLSDLANDEDMIELVEEFVDELPSRVSAVTNALQAGDMASLSRLAHQLKGAAGGYGFTPISEVAGQLECHIRDSAQLQSITQQVNELASMCMKARAK